MVNYFVYLKNWKIFLDSNDSKRNSTYNFIEINHNDSISIFILLNNHNNQGINRNNDSKFLYKKDSENIVILKIWKL